MKEPLLVGFFVVFISVGEDGDNAAVLGILDYIYIRELNLRIFRHMDRNKLSQLV